MLTINKMEENNFGMTNRFTVGDMVLLYNDRRKLASRINEARITKVCKNFYLAEKMSNGRNYSYSEYNLLPIIEQQTSTPSPNKVIK